MTDSFSLHCTFLFLSLCTFFSLSPPRSSCQPKKKKKKKATNGADSTNDAVLVNGNEAKQEWVRIIKEPRLPKSNWSWMEIASTS